ncbi:MAG: SPOR domain-containing protein [Prevotellaceae bacterium]|jgi:hypothetical protein|nr:SPOR domain-containing protein [Prevotellaceae bacterium]
MMKNMYRMIVVMLPVFALMPLYLEAQEPADSVVVYQPNMFLYLQTSAEDGSRITIKQSTAIKEQFNRYVLKNESRYKKLRGFRVRIFFDNSQNARQRSMSVKSNFQELYPDVPAYLVYENLYFKVTVGDFRTKSDALRFLQAIQQNYSGAFIIKETINYPAL